KKKYKGYTVTTVMSAFAPIPDIERLGYTRREAGFLALVAVHSGFFLRRHFNRYLHKEDGGLAHSFLTKALKKKHVQLLPFEQRRFVFHLCSSKPCCSPSTMSSTTPTSTFSGQSSRSSNTFVTCFTSPWMSCR